MYKKIANLKIRRIVNIEESIFRRLAKVQNRK